MRWIYLSPHFDDVVLSCGGLVWTQVQAGLEGGGDTAEIWTICAGQPAPGEPLSDFAQQLHARWETGPEAALVRRREDEAAAAVLGARTQYYSLPDCIYRRLPDGSFLVNGEDDLWQKLHPQESGQVASLVDWIGARLTAQDCLVSPMTLGSHVDHHLVRAAAETTGCQLAYYADYPYAVQQPAALQALLQPDWQVRCTQLSEEALSAWQEAVAQHVSQISTFWAGLPAMRAAIREYWLAGGGACLWLKTV